VLIECIEAQLFGTNCFVVADGPGEQCVVIDPGVGVTGQLEELIADHRLHPVAVLLTHGHLDHTFSVLPVCQARDVPAYIHPADRRALADPWWTLGLPVGAPIFGATNLTFAEPDDVRPLTDGEDLKIAGLTFTVRHAPGHTEGSILLRTDSEQAPVAFTGDVLFATSDAMSRARSRLAAEPHAPANSRPHEGEGRHVRRESDDAVHAQAPRNPLGSLLERPAHTRDAAHPGGVSFELVPEIREQGPRDGLEHPTVLDR